MSSENTKNASERLEQLEGTMVQVIQAVQPMELMARDLMGMKEAVKLLNNKLDAVVKNLNAGLPLTDENLSSTMTDNNVNELKAKLDSMVTSGLLVPSDTVSKDSFVVINEQNKDGKIVNPRMQFLLSNLQVAELRDKLEGLKVGDNLAFGEAGDSINVLESYSVATPAAPAAEAPATTDSAPATNEAAAPTATDSAPATTDAPAAEAAPEAATAQASA